MENIEGNGKPQEKPPEIEVIGEMSFEEADELNVPVNISIFEDPDSPGHYILRADLYKPRQDKVEQGLFGIQSQNPNTLRKIVREKIVPLYQAALAQVEAMANGKSDSLSHWNSEGLDEASSKEE